MSFFARVACLTIVSVAYWGVAVAQEEIPAAPVRTNPSPSETQSSNLLDFFSAKTPYEFWLTCVILVAGLAFAWLAIRFLRQVDERNLEAAARAMTILFVIIATMVLITAGYNNEQIAPAFGLFGTIVGYILGRGEKAAIQASQAAATVTEEVPLPPADASSATSSAGAKRAPAVSTPADSNTNPRTAPTPRRPDKD